MTDPLQKHSVYCPRCGGAITVAFQPTDTAGAYRSAHEQPWACPHNCGSIERPRLQGRIVGVWPAIRTNHGVDGNRYDPSKDTCMGAETLDVNSVLVARIKLTPMRPTDHVLDGWIIVRQGHLVATRFDEAEALEYACDVASGAGVSCFLWNDEGLQRVDCAHPDPTRRP